MKWSWMQCMLPSVVSTATSSNSRRPSMPASLKPAMFTWSSSRQTLSLTYSSSGNLSRAQGFSASMHLPTMSSFLLPRI
ncbi:hypothetical protein CF15_00970 [Pyrodictium occultum]|uniref:Uncharacterized protein n=1 Tax=Pyrodictium occultum TaxID=2309 RepID=A0A0V8RTZ2_PYROC|nr:hypothetical protein CF15_00970 [Pyrodictium occultum]